MTKAELVRAVAEKTGADQPTVLNIVAATMETIKESLIEKENVYLRGFGTFGLKHRAEKTARNISKNTTLVVPAHDLPHFKPCKEFVQAMTK